MSDASTPEADSSIVVSDGGALLPVDGGDGGDGGDEQIPFPDTPPTLLSAAKLFAEIPIANGRIIPRSENDPYELLTTLFSDYAIKVRTIRLPPNGVAHYDPREVLDFPVGTVITKTFSMLDDRRSPIENGGSAHVLETRLFVRRAAGWDAYPYVWNAEQTDAVYAPGGRVLDIQTIDNQGLAKRFSYLVPSKNQCEECHHLRDAATMTTTLTPIGPKARNLNFDVTRDGVVENQLDRWTRLGRLTGTPAAQADRPHAINAFDAAAGSIEERARTYLDVNCAHCHRPEATVGVTTQLFLDVWNTNRFNLGECKRPGSAGPGVGGTFDIVPGDHTTSILWFRVQTEESGKMMPAIGRAIEHVEGAALLAGWIDSLPTRTCTP